MKIVQVLKVFSILFLLTSSNLILSFHLKENLHTTRNVKGNGKSNTKTSPKDILKNIVDVKTYESYSQELNVLFEAVKKEKSKVNTNKLQVYMTNIIEKSKFWKKDDNRRKLLTEIEAGDFKVFYKKLLWLPKLKMIMNNMGSLELINQVIEFCKNLLKTDPETSSQCNEWIETCEDKKKAIQTLAANAKEKSTPADVKSAIDNQVGFKEMIKLAKNKEEKINLACKKAISDATPPKFCWRTGGTTIPSCGPNHVEHTAGLCYEKCKQGFIYDFSMCKLPCAKNEYNLALHCSKKSNIFDWRSREAYSPDTVTMFNKSVKCPDELPEHIGALCYRKCPPGTTDCGCCACSVDKETCGIEITKMVVTIAKGLVKLIAFAMTAGGASAIVESFSKTVDIIFSVVEGVSSIISKVFDAMSSAYEAFMKDINDENKAMSIYQTFVKNMAYKKYLLPELNESEQKNIKINELLNSECDKLSSQQWKAWKAAHSKKKKNNEKVDSSELKQIVKESYVETGLSALGLVDILQSSSPNDLIKMMEESSVNVGNMGGTILGLVDLVKQVVEAKDAYSETNQVDTAKKVMSIVEIWDPTGLTTIANALLQPKCNDDPIYRKEMRRVEKRRRRK